MSAPGQDEYEAYREHTGGRSLVSHRPIPAWEMLSQDIQDAWKAAALAHGHPVQTEINGVRASRCQAGDQLRHHTALRFVWHHILPQVCGGRTEKANLAELCDNCHYAVHAVMYQLSRGGVPDKAATDAQFGLAKQGFDLAVAAGTQGKIPKESAG